MGDGWLEERCEGGRGEVFGWGEFGGFAFWAWGGLEILYCFLRCFCGEVGIWKPRRGGGYVMPKNRMIREKNLRAADSLRYQPWNHIRI